MIKYIVFDFDGTLADTFDIIKKIVEEEFDEVSEQEINLLREKGAKEIIKLKKIKIWELPKMALRVTSKLKNKKNVKLFPEIDILIKNLNKKYRLGIVSSNSEENINQTLKKYNLEKSFEFIYSQSSIFGKNKVLKNMCKKYKINPKEVIYIGDEDRDIIAAKDNNIKISQ